MPQKKYILLKDLPDAKAMDLYLYNGSGHYLHFKDPNAKGYTRKQIEANPEFWAEVKEEVANNVLTEAKLWVVADLISRIFHYGNFKIETPNERTLAGLLNELGLFPTTEEAILRRPDFDDYTERFKDYSLPEKAAQAYIDGKKEGKINQSYLSALDVADDIRYKKEEKGKDWEILSFAEYIKWDTPSPEKSNYIYPVYGDKIGPFSNAMLLSDWIKNQPAIYKIHSVRRKSDGEVFTIGDQTQLGCINKIDINESMRLILFCGDTNYPLYIKEAEKQPAKPITQQDLYNARKEGFQEARRLATGKIYEVDGYMKGAMKYANFEDYIKNVK